MFSSLYNHKYFRYFWFGQAISTIGGIVQVTALSWYVYKISGSPFLLGLMGVFEYGPVLLLSLFAGVLVEWFPKKKILILTQIIFLVQSMALAILVWLKVENYWCFAALAIIAGIATSLDQPARQSYFVELVGKEDLPNAISLNSTTFNLARILGPAIAGIIMRYLGTAECFFINSLSFIPVIIGLVMIRIKGFPKKWDRTNNILQEIATGVSYTFGNIKIFPTFLIMAIVCTFAMNFSVVLPVFAKDVLLGNETTYSFLMSMLGLGSMGGALFMAAKGKDISNRYFLVYLGITIGILQILTLIPLHKHIIYVAVLLVLIGFTNLCFLNRANTRIQLNTDDNFRGRVMSIYVLIVTGSTPLGNTFTGFAIGLLGGKYSFFIGGFISLVLVLIITYLFRKYIGKVKVVK